MGGSVAVLIIEDSENDTLLMAHRIERAFSIEYERVETPQGLREALDKKAWDIVLSDYTMPSFNALDALRIVKERRSDAPFIVVSGTIGEERAASLIKAGAHNFVTKDNLDRLPAIIEKELEEAKDRRKLREEDSRVKENEEKYRSLIKNLNIGIFRNTGYSGYFSEANPALAKILGYTQEELLNKPIGDFYLNPQDRENNLRELEENGVMNNREFRMKKKDGTTVWVSCFARAELNEKREILFIDGIIEDISERKIAEDTLIYNAIHDPLSGLANRRFFMEQLNFAVHAAQRYGYPLSLCMCDLDNFKAINDTYGHKAGDDVIRAFADIIKHELREEDMGGRYGGDEFCIFFPHIPAYEATFSVERIRNRFRSRIFGMDEGKPFTASAAFGITDLSPKESVEKDLIKAADSALYTAKEIGRNCVVVK